MSGIAAITCSELSLIENGEITLDPDSTSPFDYGTTASYDCDEGFFLQGESNRTCGGDGSSTVGIFDGVAPVCTSKFLAYS